MSEETTVLESVEKDIDEKRKELEQIKADIEEKKLKQKRMARREYSEKENEISDKQISTHSEKKSLESKIEAQKVFDNVKVTGKFYNLRNPGQSVKLTYMKYNDDPVKWYNFEHGKIYTLPRGFADQLNEHYHTPRFITRNEPMDPSQPQSSIQEVDTSNKRYSFVPLNF